MTSIIFSNDSPGILKNFLQSAKTYEINSFNFSVLYNSSEVNDTLYLEVFNEFNITNFTKSDSFKQNLLELLDLPNTGLVAFFKDTNYFFRKINSEDIELALSNQDVFCFSLALGRNIKHCYNNDVKNILLNEEQINEEIIQWNWVKHYLDFGRPLELGAGHIFHKREIAKFFKKWQYTNIIELESSFDLLDYYPKELMASFNNSVLVDINYKTEEYNSVDSHDFNTVDRIVIEI